MKLSPRLSTIADMITEDSKVIDIGCDHAYLDIFLTFNRHNVECTAIDINRQIFLKAKKNIEHFNMTEKIKLVQANGLEGIEVDPDSTIVLSGLGTATIIKILKKDINKLSKTLIIQTNNDVLSLRKNVVKLGYYIDYEKFIKDKEKDYVIIKFLKGKRKYKSIDYLLGPILKNNQQYVQKNINRYNIIIATLPTGCLFKQIKLRYLVYKMKKRL